MREKLIKMLQYLLECELDCDCSHLAEDWADRLIDDGVTFATDNNVGDKWIPVTERLPELESYVYSVDVLFCDTDGIIHNGYVNFETGTWKCNDSKRVMQKDKATHWMPLPEPPKEVDND